MSLLLATAYIGSAHAAAPLPCGTVITANTTLQSNIGPCSGDGIIIGADNVTLNLNGYEIFGTPGPGDGTQVGVRVPFRTGVSILGKKQKAPSAGSVRDFDAGVFLNGGASNTVRSVVVRDNIGPLDSNSLFGDGIVAFHSASNQIIDNTVTQTATLTGSASGVSVRTTTSFKGISSRAMSGSQRAQVPRSDPAWSRTTSMRLDTGLSSTTFSIKLWGATSRSTATT